MKVLLLNGSTRQNGCTHTALTEVAKAIQAEGLETELVWLGSQPAQDCVACGSCARTGRCVFDDMVNTLAEKAAASDGFVFGTPVYYAHPSGQVLAILDRLFYSGARHFAGKPGAAVASARRAGTTASLDAMNKYFTIAQMPVVSSTYWNMVHGTSPQEVLQDAEGLQTMRNLGRNMAWLIKCIRAGRDSGLTPPAIERGAWTNFIR
ncbi:MAG: flavodoxin family protein [Oscillospiraceae bacterium]